MAVQSYKDLLVWQRGIDLVEQVYNLTDRLPDHERFGLVSQMRRCAISVPSNIAEGSRRKNGLEFLQFLRVADGSASELETQLIIVGRRYQDVDVRLVQELLVEVQRMLGGMMTAIRKRASQFL